MDVLSQIINNTLPDCALDISLRLVAVKSVTNFYYTPEKQSVFLRGLFSHPEDGIRNYAAELYEGIAIENKGKGEDFILRNFPGSDFAKNLEHARIKREFQQAINDFSPALRAVYVKDFFPLFDRSYVQSPLCKQIQPSQKQQVFWVLLSLMGEMTPILIKNGDNLQDAQIIWTDQENIFPVYELKTQFIIKEFISFNKVLLEDFGVISLIGIPAYTNLEFNKLNFDAKEEKIESIIASYSNDKLPNLNRSYFASFLAPYLLADRFKELKGEAVTLENLQMAYKEGVGVIVKDGVNLNEQFYLEGLVVCIENNYWHLASSQCEWGYKEAQSYAQKNRVGAWSDKYFKVVKNSFISKSLAILTESLTYYEGYDEENESFLFPDSIEYSYNWDSNNGLEIKWDNYYEDDPLADENLGFMDKIAIKRGLFTKRDIHKDVITMMALAAFSFLSSRQDDSGETIFSLLEISSVRLTISQLLRRYNYDKYGNELEISPKVLMKGKFCLDKNRAEKNNWGNIWDRAMAESGSGRIRNCVSIVISYFSCAHFY